MERQALLTGLTDDEARSLLYDWGFWARSNQLEPSGSWRTWLLLAGRGFGKTRTGAEWVRAMVETGRAGRVALVAPTAADVRDVMVEGESGILAICPPWAKPLYEPSKRRLTWPNGAIATTYSAEEPDRLRGPQHDAAWCDELRSWRYPEAYDMLMFGLRLGKDPRCVVTTTSRPTKHIKTLLGSQTCVVTRGATYENLQNLAPAFADEIVAKYEGTRLGRQELYGELLEDVEGALWTHALIDQHRAKKEPEDFTRLVVAVDPPGSEDGAEAGIVVAGVALCNCKGFPQEHAFVLADKSLQGSPAKWARTAVDAYTDFEADRILGEANNGGDMVGYTINSVDPKASFKKVWASRGKVTRAEPVAALYEQGKIHHVGTFGPLEDQMSSWIPGDDSPDRMDALVWAITDLMVGKKPRKEARSMQG